MTDNVRTDMSESNLLPLVESCKAQEPGWQRDFEALQYETAPLLRSLMSRYPSWLPQHGDDMAQAALMGLWEAVTDFDPDHPSGKSFATVAGLRMRRAMERYLAQMGGRIAVERRHGFEMLGRIYGALEASGLADPEEALSPEELDELTGVPNTHRILNAFREPVADPAVEERSLTASAEDTFWEEIGGEQERSVIALCNRMMEEAPDNADERKRMADEWCEEWGYGPDISAKIRRAVSNRL